MTRFITLRHVVTGKYGQYPEHFADYDNFEVYEPENCQDCVAEEETAPEEAESFFDYDYYEEDEEVDG